MAEDVCDSWEDMIENGVLDSKLDKLKVSAIGILENAMLADTSTKSEIEQQAGSSNPQHSIKILKRTPDDTQASKSSSGKNQQTTPASSHSKNYDLNNYINSQPFIPQSYNLGNSLHYPQITLEDNTRTQYVPQVKILKRPKNGDPDSKTSPNKNNSSMKSYEEREAEYAKARLRILGSAVPAYQEHEEISITFEAASSTSKSSSTVLPKFVSSTSNGEISRTGVPILRIPQGPDGSKGFGMKR